MSFEYTDIVKGWISEKRRALEYELHVLGLIEGAFRSDLDRARADFEASPEPYKITPESARVLFEKNWPEVAKLRQGCAAPVHPSCDKPAFYRHAVGAHYCIDHWREWKEPEENPFNEYVRERYGGPLCGEVGCIERGAHVTQREVDPNGFYFCPKHWRKHDRAPCSPRATKQKRRR